MRRMNEGNGQALEQFEATPSPSAEHPSIARRRAELERSLQDAAFQSFHFQLRAHALRCGRGELEQLQ